MEMTKLPPCSNEGQKITNIQSQVETKNLDRICENNDKFFNVKYLEAAFEEAKLALKEGEVPVGCVFVKHGQSPVNVKDIPTTSNQSDSCNNTPNIIARGRNSVNSTKNATRHAEMNCIDEIHYNVLRGR